MEIAEDAEDSVALESLGYKQELSVRQPPAALAAWACGAFAFSQCSRVCARVWTSPPSAAWASWEQWARRLAPCSRCPRPASSSSACSTGACCAGPNLDFLSPPKVAPFALAL